jgi:Uma2 family endonuclease
MTTETLLTLDAFLAMPETEPYTELIDGVPCQKPMGSEEHSQAQGNLHFLLKSHRHTRQGRARVELGIRFVRTPRGNLRVPDVSYSLPGHEDLSNARHPDRAPDLAAEVLSAGQSRSRLRERLSFLRDWGTRCTLLIDPIGQTVEAVDVERSGTFGIDDKVVLEGLPGFEFNVRALFED